MSTATVTAPSSITPPIPMVADTNVLARTVRRTHHDEPADLLRYEENRRSTCYDEWPNEAGFDGLTEERGPLELVVQGHIPTWAAGALYRTGPGSCKVDDTPTGTYLVSHWFDGFAHTHKFDIVAAGPDGPTRVFYSSRRQSDDLVASIKAAGHQNRYTFGQKADPCIGLLGKFMGVFAKGPAAGHPNICVAVHPNLPGYHADQTSTANHKGNVTTNNNQPRLGHRNGLRSLWLSTDSNPLLEIDPTTLEPLGIARQDTLHPALSGPMSCAHAQRDPDTGDLYNFNLVLAVPSTYRVFRTSASTGETEILATISGPAAKPAYIHSFFLTRSFVVLCIPSSHLAYRGMAVPWERNILDAIVPFDPAGRCRWFFVDRLHDAGLVASFDTPAGFFFHTTNAFEEEPCAGAVDVFCEMATYQNLDVLYNLYYDVLLNRDGAAHSFWTENDRFKHGYASLHRYKFRVPLPSLHGANNNNKPSSTTTTTTTTTKRKNVSATAKKAEETATITADTPSPEAQLVVSIPAPHAGELPTINPAYHTRRHRYVYSLADRGLSTLFDTIVKTDVDTRDALLWECPQAHTPGEPIFVPRPSPADEDDGVLLSVVLDGSAQRSYLLCLDARSMTELGRAECHFAVGLGFHGIHAAAYGSGND